MLNRRSFLAGASSLSLLCSTGIAGLSYARIPSKNNFVLVILRGGMDGLAAIPPFGDRNYEELRKDLAISSSAIADGVINIDGYFGFHPSFEDMVDLYKQKDLAIFHSVATPYRSRSHFAAQDVLENGTSSANGANDGWLNRTLGLYSHIETKSTMGLALNNTIPLILSGEASTTSWMPNARKMNNKFSGNFMDKMAHLYSRDEKLSSAFGQAKKTKEMLMAGMSEEDRLSGRGASRAENFDVLTKSISALLKDPEGPKIVVAETGGWDTHANQGSIQGSLSNKFEALAKGIKNLKTDLGDEWKKTVVVVVTEFGRTVEMNGTGGTDHGTAGVAFVAGGRVNGGRILGKWPGLKRNNLYQGRDLMPTTDMRSIFKTVLVKHLGINLGSVESKVFPNSGTATVKYDLIT